LMSIVTQSLQTYIHKNLQNKKNVLLKGHPNYGNLLVISLV